MLAYKGTHKDMTCTMGTGRFKYKLGKTYTEKNAKTASTGFHACENPLDVLTYYSNPTDRYFAVNAEGDINEDGDNKLACTKITLIKELSFDELILEACRYMVQHPERQMNYRVQQDTGIATASGRFVIVRGKDPVAQGKEGTSLYLLQEEPDTPKIKAITMYVVGGEVKPDTLYNIEGRCAN